ncbi:Bacilysin biosynthesis oxidoreductase BacC [Aspergillus unguis]
MVHEFKSRFQDKVVAVTGGASGMGAAMVKRYIAEGARVLVADFCDKSKGEDFISQFPRDKVYFHHCDIGDPVQAASVVSETVRQFGDIDIVHNNAGTGAIGDVTKLEPSEWSRIMRVNLDGPFHISRAAVTEMQKHTEKKTRGVIVNTISTAGIVSEPGLAAYSASKAGLANLTRAMAADHGADGIRVNAVAPGWTRTAMSTATVEDPVLCKKYSDAIPLGRIGEAEELAAVMMFFASDDASYVNGAVLNVDGGLLCLSRMPKLEANPGEIH